MTGARPALHRDPFVMGCRYFDHKSGSGNSLRSKAVIGRPRVSTLPGQATSAGSDTTYAWFVNDRVHTQTTTGPATGPVTQTSAYDPLNRVLGNITAARAGGTVAGYSYADSSDAPVAIDTASTDGSVIRQVFAGGIDASMSMTVTTNITPTPGSAAPPSWWHLPTTGDATEITINNPHGDVIATIPNTTNVPPAQLSTVSTYDPFGTTATGPTPHPYGWEGQTQRDNTNPAGIITMGARLYNPTTGRFLTQDPVPGGNPNPYTYPPDPIGSEDLDGQWGISFGFSFGSFSIGISIGTTSYSPSRCCTSSYNRYGAWGRLVSNTWNGYANLQRFQAKATQAFAVGMLSFARKKRQEPASEHSKNKRPSTQELHQKGTVRETV